jgi:CelD/BcsL family acetyltransferase involved in cellulose biosynthesis/RimJ/RimL family protein N-acetyltransferase
MKTKKPPTPVGSTLDQDSGPSGSMAPAESQHPDQGGGCLEHEVFHTFAQANRLRSAWDELAAREGDLFCSFDWCSIWWQHYGKGRRLRIHAFHKGGKLVGIVPLFEEIHALGLFEVRALRIVGCDHTTTTCNIAVYPDCVRDVTAALVRSISDCRWDVLQFGLLPGYSHHPDVLFEVLAASDHVGMVEYAHDPRPHTLLDLPEEFNEFLKRLSSRERQSIGKENRRLEREFRIRRDDAAGKEGGHAAIQQFIRFHQRQWKQKHQQGHFADWPGAEEFHRDVVDTEDIAGRLRLRSIHVDGELFSMAYAIRFGRRLHWLLAARSLDPRWHFCFPGRVAACDLVQTAIADGVRQIELGIGYYDYKLKLGGRLFPAASITVVRTGWRARAKVWGLRRIALAHDLLGRRLWYQHVLPRCPVLSTPFYEHLIRRTLWPADGRRAVICLLELLLWPMSQVRRARRRIAEGTDLRSILGLFQHQFRKFCRRRSVVYTIDTRLMRDANTTVHSGFHIRRYRMIHELDDHEKESLIKHSGKLLMLQFEKDLLQGDELWISHVDGKPAGVCWSVRCPPLPRYFVPLGSGDVTIRKCFTFPEFRNRGVYSTALRHMVAVLASEGARRIFIDCRTWNTASCRGITKAGFTEFGIATMPLLPGLPRIKWHTYWGAREACPLAQTR